MPADYSSTAAALSLSPSPLPSPGGDETRPPPPPWARPHSGSIMSSSSSRRLAMRPYNLARHSANTSEPFLTYLVRTGTSLGRQGWTLFLRLPPLHRLAALVVAAAGLAAGVTFLVYSHRIFAWLGPVAQGWRELPGGWVLLWLLTFATAFPPMVGYSSTLTIAGFVYRFPLGWPVVASATVAGSTAAFLTSRTVFSGYVHRLVGKDPRFVALGQVLRRDGILVLAAVRFCPLPYSLSNGFLATIPSISPWAFAASTAMASPKLLVHIFIGDRLAQLAEKGDAMTTGDKAINYISMAISGLVGLVVGVLVFKRTMTRAAEIAAEEGPQDLEAGATAADYADSEEARLMMDPDAAAALMEDDDISLWGADEFDDAPRSGGGGGGYRDSGDDKDSERKTLV